MSFLEKQKHSPKSSLCSYCPWGIGLEPTGEWNMAWPLKSLHSGGRDRHTSDFKRTDML